MASLENLFGLATLSLISTLSFAVCIPAPIYLIAAWRADKQGAPEPHLTLVTFFGFFAYLGFTLLSLALTALAVTATEDLPGQVHRTFAAIAAAGLILLLASGLPLRRKLAGARSRAARAYVTLAGFAAATAATIGLIATLIALFLGRSFDQPLILVGIQGLIAFLIAARLTRST